MNLAEVIAYNRFKLSANIKSPTISYYRRVDVPLNIVNLMRINGEYGDMLTIWLETIHLRLWDELRRKHGTIYNTWDMSKLVRDNSQNGEIGYLFFEFKVAFRKRIPDKEYDAHVRHAYKILGRSIASEVLQTAPVPILGKC